MSGRADRPGSKFGCMRFAASLGLFYDALGLQAVLEKFYHHVFTQIGFCRAKHTIDSLSLSHTHTHILVRPPHLQFEVIIEMFY